MALPVAGAAIRNDGMRRDRGAVSMWKVHVVLALIECNYASSTIVTKLAFTGGFNPIVFSICRGVGGAVFVSPWAFFAERGKRTPLDWRTVGLIFLLGSCGIYTSQLALGFGQALAPPAYSCLIGITSPIFVFIMSATFGLEEVKWTRWSGLAKVAGVLSAVAGAILIPLYNGPVVIPRLPHAVPVSDLPLDVHEVAVPIFQNLNIEDSVLGGFLLVSVGMFGAFYWTLQAEILKTYPAPITLSVMSRLIAGILMTVTGLVTIKDPSDWEISRLSDILAVVYAGTLGYGLSFALECWAAKQCGPVLTVAYHPLQSSASIAMAYFVFNTNIYLGSLLGLLCMINGLFWITWGKLHSLKEVGHPVKFWASPVAGETITQDGLDSATPLLA